MVKFLYITATILIAIWAIGFFLYSLGALIHLLLLLALITLILRFVRRKDYTRRSTTGKAY